MQSRRKFIRNSGLAVAGSSLLPYCAPPKTTEEQEVVKRNIGLQVYTVRNEIKEDIVATLSKVAEIGYKEIEVYGAIDGKFFGLTPAEFGKLLDSLGLEIISGHYGTGRANPESIGTLTNGWDRAVEAMVEVGQKYAALGWLPESERTLDQYKELVDIMIPAAEKCKEAGIQFCHHNHDFEFMEVEGEIPMYYILDNTDPELVKMELDLYWISKVGLDPIEFFKKYEGRIPLWHVKDMDTNQDFTEVGNGTIDFKRIFEHQELAGMKHFFVEQDQSPDPINSVTQSFGYVSKELI